VQEKNNRDSSDHNRFPINGNYRKYDAYYKIEKQHIRIVIIEAQAGHQFPGGNWRRITIKSGGRYRKWKK